jgi:hypothetical protein
MSAVVCVIILLTLAAMAVAINDHNNDGGMA